jgi:hypothetical protein
LRLDPAWTEAFFAADAPVYIGNAQAARASEHCRRCVHHTHVRIGQAPAHQGGVEVRQEIMAVLKIRVAFGVQASNLAVPILAEELRRLGARQEE